MCVAVLCDLCVIENGPVRLIQPSFLTDGGDMSYFLRAPKGRTKWYLWETIYKDGKRERKAVPTELYPVLGINPDYSTEEARIRVKQLNKEKSVERRLWGPNS